MRSATMKSTKLSAIVGCILSLGMIFVACLPARKAAAGGIDVIIVGDEKKAAEKVYKRESVWLGVYFQSVTRSIAKKLDYPDETGIIITKVIADSPAERDGLKDGDIIISFDGTLVEGQEQFGTLVAAHRPEDAIDLVVFREGAKKKIDVTLGRRPESYSRGVLGRYTDDELQSVQKALSSTYLQSYFMRGRIGLDLRELNDDLAPYFGVESDEGVLVLDVEEESPAEKAGIKSGDIIVEVNGVPVSNAEVVLEVLSETESGSTASIEVVRKGARKSFEIEAAPGFDRFEWVINPFEKANLGKAITVHPLVKKPDTADIEKELQQLKERMRELERRLKEKENN